MPAHSHLKLVAPDEAYERFHRFVDERLPDENANISVLSIERRESAARFWCPDHDWVIPWSGRLCPYCMPIMPDDPRPRVISIERASGMVVLNAT